MTTSDRERTALHEALDEAVGPDNADTLMGYLPPVGWGDVARRSDLDALRMATKAEVEGLRAEMQAEIGGLRTEMKAEIRASGSELRAQMATLEATVERSLRLHTMWTVGALFAAVAAAASVVQLLG